jgi:phosphinothricin acetyltransferase
MPERVLRSATAADAAACASIYAPFVAETAISFETEPPDAAAMAERIATAQRTHAWLVLEEDGELCAYAYGGFFRTRRAYRFTAEVAIYVRRGSERTGAGRRLYGALFERLAERGYRRAVAGMTLPNEASEGLHRALGFEPVGVFRRVGYKLGAWHDVGWFQRPLLDGGGPPAELQ